MSKTYKRYGININRQKWKAVYVVESNIGLRARGALYDGVRLVRPKFSVSIKEDGKFSVDVGTGSGVKIVFDHNQVTK